MKAEGILFGCNYAGTANELRGCINDVRDTAALLTSRGVLCQAYTDDKDTEACTAMGMVTRLYQMALRTYSENLDFLWISYSGHGTSVADTNGDEKDGLDEVIVPCDFETAGCITDDTLSDIMAHINPKTRVVCVFDACHSGSIVDPLYMYETSHKASVVNLKSRIKAKLMCISGCKDDQTSADAYDQYMTQYSGALTSALLRILRQAEFGNDVFNLLTELRLSLKADGFDQIPCLTSSYNLGRDPALFPSDLALYMTKDPALGTVPALTFV